MTVASEILDALSHKPDFELISILLAPDDWQPEIVERARAELLARGVDITEMQSKQQRELERFSLEPLSDNTKVCIAILAIFFGLPFPAFSDHQTEGITLHPQSPSDLAHLLDYHGHQIWYSCNCSHYCPSIGVAWKRAARVKP